LAVISEFLRKKQRDDEIDQQQNGTCERNRRDWMEVHGLPQFMTGFDVEKRQPEEDRGEQQHECILHSRSPCCGET
jgi:hypothetical protein